MAAAPRLLDDSLFASPELALVDVDLAAQLRADICTGDEFRPRSVARPEYRYLRPVVVALVEPPQPASAVQDAVATDDLAADPELAADLGEVAFLEPAPAPPATDNLSELADYIVLTDDAAADDPVSRLPEYVVSEETDADAVGETVLFDVAQEPTETDDLLELPDSIVLTDAAAADDPVSRLPEYVVSSEETDADDVGGALPFDVAQEPTATDDLSELPDYIVLTDVAAADDPVSRLPEYVVSSEETDADDVGDALPFDVAQAPASTDDLPELPDYVVRADELVYDDLVRDVDVSVQEPTISDYPVLPDLGDASDALDETDAALRKIREQMVSDAPSRGRRVRRGFTIASGLGVVAALAVFAVDVQQGVAVLPGWLGF